ncbi:M20 metallopeptidase family protein [Polaribacter porphyrae]|uniref:Amidohydrolase n=1 Tax=Polaribacter porphyrae TaxID=1137780 RepID=A0A2S7WRA6_9FLAO|nr:M20 family metallopeptidase [Polaribacter porphyrae]PQJ79821.1 hypothetical protein BTO18_11825 [Polaribacter porphyrae]
MRNLKFKNFLLIISLLFISCSFYGQNLTNKNSIHQNVENETKKIYKNLIEIRRDLHKHPELSEKEKRTSKIVEEYLVNLGLEVHTNIGGYGVVGILRGSKEGKKIAWRADIDAMSSDIEDIVDFKSLNKGVRHICGHDIHTAIGLGIAHVLGSVKENLKGTVYFIFQPSEENYKGALAMIDDKLFEIIKPDEIYGTHVAPFPSGVISTKKNNIYAHRTIIELVYENSINEEQIIKYTKELLNDIQTIEPNSPFWNQRYLLDPNIGMTNPNTIFKDYTVVSSDFNIQDINNTLKISTILDFSDQQLKERTIDYINKQIKQSEFKNSFVSAKYQFEKETPMNDSILTMKVVNSISKLYGKEKVITMHGVGPAEFGDDFAYFQNYAPGVYFFLGASNFEKGLVAMPHSPSFAIDESCIKVGVNFFSSLIIERINKL